MADLPLAHLRLFKPAFCSARMGCFGPFLVKVGRCSEKWCGILLKCLTRAVHIDLLAFIDMDSDLMAFRGFIARRGKKKCTLTRGQRKGAQEGILQMSSSNWQSNRSVFTSTHQPHHIIKSGLWRSAKESSYWSWGHPEHKTPRICFIWRGCHDPVSPNYLLMGRADSPGSLSCNRTTRMAQMETFTDISGLVLVCLCQTLFA